MLLLFTNDSQRVVNKKYQTIERLSYGGIIYNLRFWFDDEDLKNIKQLQELISHHVKCFETIADENVFFKKFKLICSKRRKPYFFSEPWLQIYNNYYFA